MVSYRDYKPLQTITPQSALSSITKPWDFGGFQKELQTWENLYNAQNVNERNSRALEEEAKKREEEQAFEEELRRRVGEGEEVEKIDRADIYKDLGQFEKYLEQVKLNTKKEKDLQAEEFLRDSKLAKLGKDSPEKAKEWAQRFGTTYEPPPQKTGNNSGKEKPVKSQLFVDPKTGTTRSVDVNSVQETREAKSLGLIPIDQMSKIDPFFEYNVGKEKAPPPETPAKSGKGILANIDDFIRAARETVQPIDKKRVFRVERP